jgi:hypothetical protein
MRARGVETVITSEGALWPDYCLTSRRRHRVGAVLRDNWTPIGPHGGAARAGKKSRTSGFAGLSRGVSEGTRTPDRLDHNRAERVPVGRAAPNSLGFLLLGSYGFLSTCSPTCSPSCMARRTRQRPDRAQALDRMPLLLASRRGLSRTHWRAQARQAISFADVEVSGVLLSRM